MAPRHLRIIIGLALAAVVAAVVAAIIGVNPFKRPSLDPTSSAIFISDSPDGRYRCAVFCNESVGHPEYEAGLFDGHWPHRELPGGRAKWNNDSVGSFDFRPTWCSNGVDINYCTGYGDNRATVGGRDLGGKQGWGEPVGSEKP